MKELKITAETSYGRVFEGPDGVGYYRSKDAWLTPEEEAALKRHLKEKEEES